MYVKTIPVARNINKFVVTEMIYNLNVTSIPEKLRIEDGDLLYGVPFIPRHIVCLRIYFYIAL